MKMQICGIEISEGTSKAGKPYSIGNLHTLTQLAPPLGEEGNIAKGLMGSTYRADVNLVRKIAHLPFPIVCDVEIGAQMRFGERQEVVLDIHPVDVVKKAA